MKARAARRYSNPEDSQQWFMARIASVVVGVPGKRDPKQERLLGKDGKKIGMLRSFSSVWQLRMSMPEYATAKHAGSVGSRSDGEPLTYEHFFYALVADDPAGMVRRAARENLSPSEVLALSNEELRRRKEIKLQQLNKAMGWD